MKASSDDISPIQPRYLPRSLPTTMQHSLTVPHRLTHSQTHRPTLLTHSLTDTLHSQSYSCTQCIRSHYHSFSIIIIDDTITHISINHCSRRLRTMKANHWTTFKSSLTPVSWPLTQTMEEVSMYQCNNVSFMGLNNSLHLTNRWLLLRRMEEAASKSDDQSQSRIINVDFFSFFR